MIDIIRAINDPALLRGAFPRQDLTTFGAWIMALKAIFALPMTPEELVLYRKLSGLTGTAAELTPVREVDHRQIGEGRRGPVAEELQAAFFDVVTGADSRYAKWRTFVD